MALQCRPLITETLIPEQADEDEDKPNEEHKSFAESVHTWVSNIFDRGNKTEIEKVQPVLSCCACLILHSLPYYILIILCSLAATEFVLVT